MTYSYFRKEVKPRKCWRRQESRCTSTATTCIMSRFDLTMMMMMFDIVSSTNTIVKMFPHLWKHKQIEIIHVNSMWLCDYRFTYIHNSYATSGRGFIPDVLRWCRGKNFSDQPLQWRIQWKISNAFSWFNDWMLLKILLRKQ